MILKQLGIYLGVILLITSCYQYENAKKPKNLISKEKMVDVLIDVRLVAASNNGNKKVLKKNSIDVNTYVFTKHNIDSLQFALSNEYYAFNIKEYEEIYAKVKDSLEKLKAIYKSLELKEAEALKAKKKKDSIMAIRLKAKDSTDSIAIRYPLKKDINKDSLSKIMLNNEFKEEMLISPVSDTIFRHQ